MRALHRDPHWTTRHAASRTGPVGPAVERATGLAAEHTPAARTASAPDLGAYFAWTFANDADPYADTTLAAYVEEHALDPETVREMGEALDAEFAVTGARTAGRDETYSRHWKGTWDTDGGDGAEVKIVDLATGQTVWSGMLPSAPAARRLFDLLSGRYPDPETITDAVASARAYDEARRQDHSLVPSQRPAARTAATAQLTTGATHRVSGWDWDHRLSGFVARAGVDRFACPCGTALTVPSFTSCHCGRVWNFYEVQSKSGTKLIGREVPRRDVVLGSRELP